MPKKSKRIRYAVVGLGYISQAAVLPAFAHAGENSELVALVSGDPVKRRKLARRFGAKLHCGYEQYDPLLSSGEIDAVYIALPNDLHRDYAVRAAQSGVHVLCEKPMAVTSADCEAMIAAAAQGGVRLMVGYRLHFEPGNLEAIELVSSGRLGEPRAFNSVFTMPVRDGDIRTRSERGGGPVYDIGIYCLNAARSIFGEEPLTAFAAAFNGGKRRFREIEETMAVVLRFPGEKSATFTCSFGAVDEGRYEVLGTQGKLEVDDAYDYVTAPTRRLTVDGPVLRKKFRRVDQFAAELVYFSDCILGQHEPEPSGEEGLADVRVIEAIHRSAVSGRVESVGQRAGVEHPKPEQRITLPPVKGKPVLVHARKPSRKNAA